MSFLTFFFSPTTGKIYRGSLGIVSTHFQELYKNGVKDLLLIKTNKTFQTMPLCHRLTHILACFNKNMKQNHMALSRVK